MGNHDYDVAIVGGGPVGLTLASLLARHGHRIALIERFRQVYPLPRAIRLDGEVMRVFQSFGIIREIEDELTAMEGYRWVGADGEEIVYIPFGVMAPSGWNDNYCFWQPAVDEALDRKAASWPNVEMLRGWAVEGIDQDDEQVTLHTRYGTEEQPGDWQPTDEVKSLNATYVIGADGANSVIRTASEIEQTDFGFDEHWLVIDARPDDLSRWPARVAEQRCDPARPTVLVPNGSVHRRWEFMLLPGEEPSDFADPERVWELLEPHLGRDEGELVRSAVYQFRSKVADQWRKGRVLLAGDAAHVMPPFMGEGMCSGIRDATNLAWRVDLVLRGIAPPSLLDSYGSERRPHTESTIEVSVQMGRVSCTIDPEAAAARDRAFRSGEVPPPPPAPKLLDGTVRAEDPVAGTLTPQGTMRTPDGRVGRLDDLVGAGFALVCRRGDPSALPAETLAFLDSIGAAVVTLDPAAHSLSDTDGTVTKFMEELGIDCFLARPDGYGFGSAADQSEVSGLVEELRGALGAATHAA